jgi:sulfur carrier protein ThiS
MIRIVGRETRRVDDSPGSDIEAVAKINGLSGERYIAILNGKPVTWDHRIDETDDLVFVEVFSGG